MMTFGSSVFWEAFKAAGMLVEAELLPATVPPTIFDVGFQRPDEIVLDGVAHTTNYSIEYQTVDVELKRGSTVKIDGATYRVSQSPQAKGDGGFVRTFLEKVS